MQILDDESRAVLQVVDYAERSGKPLSTAEFQAFAKGPKRIVKVTRSAALTLALPEVSTTESVHDFVTRTQLVAVSDGGVRLSRLGRIVLNEADEVETMATQAQDVVLAAGDEWATRDMLRVVSQAGRCMVVDPYCREPQLNDLVRHTETTRVLIGPAVAREDFELTVGRIRPPKELELRVSASVHDRHVIPDAGQVLAFGSSLGGIGGRKPSIVVRLSDDMSRAVRGTYEELWDKAEPWAAVTGEATT